ESPGWLMVDDVPGAVIDRLFAERVVAVDEAGAAEALAENEFAVLRAGQQSALARRKADALHLLRHNLDAFDLRPRNIEQRLALDLLLDPDVSVVALDVTEGTGKTLLAVAAGLEDVWNDPTQRGYEKMAIYRPIVAVGRQELGFLPGTMDEKLDPWMGAIHDAVVALSDGRRKDAADETLAHVTADGRLTMESVTYLRGLPAQQLRASRRVAEPGAVPGQDAAHPGRRGDQGGVHRGHQPDRRPVPVGPQQRDGRPHRCVRRRARRPAVRSHPPDPGRAQPAGVDGSRPAVAGRGMICPHGTAQDRLPRCGQDRSRRAHQAG